VIPTAPERKRNSDNDFPYRYDSHFHHLTGFGEPQAWLVLDALGRKHAVLPPARPRARDLDGLRLGPDAAPAALGVDAAFPVSELDTRLPGLLANQPTLWFPFGVHEGLLARIETWMGSLRERSREGIECPSSQRDLNPLLDEMRW
jgi:Xaa-Pro aminopeptidase